MDKREKIYVRSLVVAEAANVHLDTLSRLIYEGKLTADAHIEWGTDKVTGATKYRPIFLRSRVQEVVTIIQKYVRTYTTITRHVVAIDAECEGQ